MADHIPFVASNESADLVQSLYSDSDVVRLPLERASKLLPRLSSAFKVWLDPCIDGLDDLDVRRSTPTRENDWFEHIKKHPRFEKIAKPAYHAKPVAAEVEEFVNSVLNGCLKHKPSWITVPQLPLVNGAERNKINHALATATGRWKVQRQFGGHLILPLIFTHQDQTNLKTARNPKVKQAERCYQAAQADGMWVVDSSLDDECGQTAHANKRFPAIIHLHEELNARINSNTTIAGPYWGLNLVLWVKDLATFPAIGVGTGYRYFPTGIIPINPPATRVALRSLKRRVKVAPEFKEWLDEAVRKLGPSHPVCSEFKSLFRHYTTLSSSKRAKEQVARFYKEWFDAIAAVPEPGRLMAVFQELAAAYAFGKSLPSLTSEKGRARRPEAVAEPLMLNCL